MSSGDQASIPSSWLSRPSPEVAPDLIGCTLVRHFPEGGCYRGLIVETEAYGPGDPACHAYRRRTPRNEVMFGPAGVSYVYLIYGLYHCFNVVTDQEGVPSAVLIRALQLSADPSPPSGRSPKSALNRLAAGPGKLCRVFHIDLNLKGLALQPGNALWLEHRSSSFQQALDHQEHTLLQTTRIGLSQGTELPWRWYLQNSPAVSKR